MSQRRTEIVGDRITESLEFAIDGGELRGVLLQRPGRPLLLGDVPRRRIHHGAVRLRSRLPTEPSIRPVFVPVTVFEIERVAACS